MISLPLLHQSLPPGPVPVLPPADRRTHRRSLRRSLALTLTLALVMCLALLTAMAWAETAPEPLRAHQEVTPHRPAD